MDTFYAYYDKLDRPKLSALGDMPTQAGSQFNATKAQGYCAKAQTTELTVDIKSMRSNKDAVEGSVHGQKGRGFCR